MYRSHGDQSASLISSAPAFQGGVIPIYHPNGGGIIYRPTITHIKCGKGGDSGGHCDRWCPTIHSVGDVTKYGYPGDGCGGSWRPADFGIYLERQAAWQVHNRRLQYNEIIVNGDYCTAHLPGCIDAFFYAGASGAAEARSQHGLFQNDYPHANVPLVRLNLHNWQSPFSAG